MQNFFCRLHWLFILLAIVSAFPVWSEPRPIPFNQAVCLALETNPRIKASAAKIDAAKADVQKAIGEGLPRLDFNASGSVSDNPLTVFIYRMLQGRVSFANLGLQEFAGPNSFNVMPSALNNPAYYRNYNSAFVVKFPIYAGGKFVAQTEQARSLVEAAKDGDQAARGLLVLELLQAYEGVHTARALVIASKQSLTAARGFLHSARVLFKQGISVESDVLLAESNQRKAKTNLALAKAQEQNQLDTFRVLMGCPGSDFIPGPPVNIVLPPKPLSVLECLALENNSQLQSAENSLRASYKAISLANARNWPQIDLMLRHDWDSPSPGWGQAKSDNTGILQLTWELFSSGAQDAAVKKAAAEYYNSKAEFENERNNLRLLVGTVFRLRKTTDMEVRANNVNVKQTREATRLLALRYQQGFTTLTSLLDSQAKLDIARADRIMAQYNAVISRARLLLLLNALAPDRPPPLVHTAGIFEFNRFEG